MKKGLLFSILTCCLVLTGCSGGSKKSGEDIQEKIDEAGWNVTYNKGGTAADYVKLEVAEDEILDVIHDKDTDKISHVSYSNELIEGNYQTTRSLGEKDDKGLVDKGEMSCSHYNITKDEEDTNESNPFKACKADDVSQLKDLVKDRDKLLKDNDLTLDDLFTWGEWYFKNK